MAQYPSYYSHQQQQPQPPPIDPDNPPVPPQHHILPQYSTPPQHPFPNQVPRYQMPTAGQLLQSSPQSLQRYGSTHLPTGLSQPRQSPNVYTAYPGMESSPQQNSGFAFLNNNNQTRQTSDLYINTHSNPNHPVYQNQSLSPPSAGSASYIASPTTVPNNSAIGSLGRLTLSPNGEHQGGARPYNPADYASPPSPPQHLLLSPSIGGMGSLMSPLLSPIMPSSSGGISTFGNSMAPYNQPTYNSQPPIQNVPVSYATGRYPADGAFPTNAYTGGAYGAPQSYAIGAPNTASGITNSTLGQGGWGYGGLQSLYVPSDPPPLPSVPGMPLGEAESAQMDGWEEREWEEHEREWELEQQSRLTSSDPNAPVLTHDGHPLPSIPTRDSSHDNPYSRLAQNLAPSVRVLPHDNQKSEIGLIPEEFPARSGAANSSVRIGGGRHGGNEASPSKGSDLDALFRETEAAFRREDTQKAGTSPARGEYENDRTRLPESPIKASATVLDGGFSEAGYFEGIYDYDHGFDYEWDQTPVDLGSANANRAGRRASFEVGDEGSFIPSRPLPALPSATATPSLGGQYGQTLSPVGPDLVPRSASLVWRPNGPEVTIPVRSKTDASEHFAMVNMSSGIGLDGMALGLGLGTGMEIGLGMMDLPALPPSGRRFVPAKMGSAQFDRCSEPWAYSSLIRWLKDVTVGESDLRTQLIVDGLVRLFTHKIPTMNTADAEMLASAIVANLRRVGVMEQEEEWVRFSAGTLSGVIVQLTGSGCYSAQGHNDKVSGVGLAGSSTNGASLVLTGRCYSRTCQRTLRKIELTQQVAHGMAMEQGDKGGWLAFYRIQSAALKGVTKREIERQNVIHEIVQKEEAYRRQLAVLSDVFRMGIQHAQPPIIESSRMKGFLESVFGRLDSVRMVNEESLLPQLKYRQLEQGPWLAGVSDIFREWIRKAKPAYIDYAARYPHAHMVVRREIEKNIRFKAFMESALNDPRCDRLEWSTFLKAPISALQHYGLLLSTVLRSSAPELAETELLKKAIGEIKSATHECDDQVAEKGKKIELMDLKHRLQLRPNMGSDLQLDQLGRQLLHKGVLSRPRANRLGWIESYAVLFDHCLVLAKSGRNGYDVSRLPIPIDLLVLDSTPSTGAPGTTLTLGIPGMRSGEDGGNIPSGGTAVTTITPASATDPDKPLFQFRVQHLGNDTYNLYTTSAAARDEWCNKITVARISHAAALKAQNAEPFKIRVLADSAFGYDAASASTASTSTVAKPLLVAGSPLDSALREVEGMFATSTRPGLVCRGKVNCAVSFTYVPTPASPGIQLVAVGTDNGIFVADFSNPRSWVRAVSCGKVTQLAVMEQFSVLLALIDKALVAYPLDIIGGTASGEAGNGGSTNGISSSTPGSSVSNKKMILPQKLSGGRGDVGFFAIGRMKERAVVFYKKREGLSSVFKVIEPVAPKSSSSSVSSSGSASSTHSAWSSIFRHRQADSFRDYDKFYIPTECTNLSLFNSSVAVTTSRGFEVLTLDKKQTWSVPNLEGSGIKLDAIPTSGSKQGSVNAASPAGAISTAAGAASSLSASIATRIQNQTPLSMFRLSDQEFLVCYTSRAVYVDRYGDVSRSVVMEFVGKAKTAAVFGGYLILFDPSFVEIRSIGDGRLRQVIVGRDVRCLDDGRTLLPADPATLNILNGPSMRRGRLNGASVASTVASGISGTTLVPSVIATAAMMDRTRSIKFGMRHPEHDRVQLVLELMLEEVVE